jgi:C-terminal processing protease CtpA/Prc
MEASPPRDKLHVDQAILNPPQLSAPKQSPNKFTITAPPGRLGIRLENSPSKRRTVVALVLEASPLQGKIRVGDMIVGVNGVDVSGMDTYGSLFLEFAVGTVTVNT